MSQVQGTEAFESEKNEYKKCTISWFNEVCLVFRIRFAQIMKYTGVRTGTSMCTILLPKSTKTAGDVNLSCTFLLSLASCLRNYRPLLTLTRIGYRDESRMTLLLKQSLLETNFTNRQQGPNLVGRSVKGTGIRRLA